MSLLYIRPGPKILFVAGRERYRRRGHGGGAGGGPGPGGQQGKHISYRPTQGDSVSVGNRARGQAGPAHQLPSYPRWFSQCWQQGQGASRASTSVTVLPKVIQSVLAAGPGGQQGQHISYCPTQGDSVSVGNRARGPAGPAHQLPSFPRWFSQCWQLLAKSDARKFRPLRKKSSSW